MFRSNNITTTQDHKMSDSTNGGLNRPEYNITTTMDTRTPDGGHNKPEPSKTKVDTTSTTTNDTKTLKRVSDCHIKGNKTNANLISYNSPNLNHNKLHPYQFLTLTHSHIFL